MSKPTAGSPQGEQAGRHPARRTGWRHETRLPVEPLSASKARAFVCRHLVDHRLLHLVAPVRLVASELATDAIIHGHTHFTVTLSLTDDVVTLTVQDDSSALAQPRGFVRSDRGRQAAIVGTLSQQWGVHPGVDHGTTVWASFPRQRPASP